MSRAGVVLGLVALAACSGEPTESTDSGAKESSGAGGSASASGGEAGSNDGQGGDLGSGSGGSGNSGAGSNQGGDAGEGGGPTPECEEGDARAGDTPCGVNGRGTLREECSGEHWQESSFCDDPDECVNAEEKWGNVCNGGTELITCLDGAWVAECVDAWRVTLGTVKNDVAKSFDLDASGNSYVVGLTTGDLDGVNAGYDDAFLMKLDAQGQPLWKKQWGTTTPDAALDVARTGDGSIFVIGNTDSEMSSEATSGSTDAFLRKVNAEGSELWTKQWGTLSIEAGLGVFTHGDCVYGVGRSEGIFGASSYGASDAWARRADPASGEIVWTEQWGSDAYDEASRGTTDSDGDVIVVGYTEGAIGTQTHYGAKDAFVRKLASDTGAALWTTQFGTAASDAAVDVLANADDDVVVIGTTAGALPDCENEGGVDTFLLRLDATSGEVELEMQWGTAGDDVPWAITRDAAGNYHVAGSTSGDLRGESAGLNDAFLTKLDPSGVVLWSEQWGTGSDEIGCGLGLDASQGVYVVGTTAGALSGPSLGENDVFLQHYPAR
jgi:hypothetical protein